MIYVVEIDYYDGSEKTLYFASGSGLNGTPTDTPANVVAEPRLISPGSYEQHLFRPGTTIGASEVGFGTIVLNNADGALDAMRDYGYSRGVRLYRGEKPAAYPGGFELFFTGTAEQVEFTENEIVVTLANRQAELYNLPVVDSVFSGDTTSGSHVNGTADDLQGKSYPWVIGNGGGENWSPPMVNASKQTFMVSAKRMTNDWVVWMEGAVVTKGNGHASIADLQAATVSSGTWDYYLGDGVGEPRAFFRIGGSIAGRVTMSGTAYRASGTHTAAACCNDIFAHKGETLDSTSISDLNTANSAVTGIYIPTGGLTCGEALDALLEGVGAGWYATADGTFKLKRLESPAGGSSVATFFSWQLLGAEKVRRLTANDPGAGLPASRVDYNYNRNYTVMTDADLAGIVSSDLTRVSRLKNEFKTKTAAAAGGVTTKYPKAVPFPIFSLLTDSTAAQTEADRQIDLREVPQDFISVDVANQDAVKTTGEALSIGDIVTLEYSRYSNTGSDKYAILGIAPDFAENVTTLFLWRPRT